MKINEAVLSNLLGILPSNKKQVSPQEKGGFNTISNWWKKRKSGLSKEQQLAYDNFVKNFVSNGVNAINTAVRTNLLDPKDNTLIGPWPTLEKKQKRTRQRRQKQTKQPQQQTQPGYKPTMRQDKQTGQWKPITVPLDGINYTKTKQGWINDKKQLANPNYQVLLDKLLAQSLSEAIQYIKMQRLYESLINETVKSISQWTRDHFLVPYLKGIDLSSGVEQINAILQNLPDSYANNTLKDDLAKIADIAWALEMASQARETPGTF